LEQEVNDTDENLKNAALDVAKIWSSVGVPYPLQGSRKYVSTNESYYSGGGDKASTDTIAVQNGLRMLRQNKGKVFRGSSSDGSSNPKKKRIIFFSIIGIALISLSIYAYVKIRK